MLGLSGLTQTAIAALPLSLTIPPPPPPDPDLIGGRLYQTTFELMSVVCLEGVFADAIEGVYVDAGAVEVFILPPTGPLVQIPNPVRRSVGHYSYTFVVNQSGEWTYKWQGTGSLSATSPDSFFTVESSLLIPG